MCGTIEQTYYSSRLLKRAHFVLIDHLNRPMYHMDGCVTSWLLQAVFCVGKQVIRYQMWSKMQYA
jgi:hypothetical protein